MLNVKSVHQHKFIFHNRLQQSSKFTSTAVWPRKEAHIGSVGLHFNINIKPTFNIYIKSREREAYLIQEVFGVIARHDGGET